MTDPAPQTPAGPEWLSAYVPLGACDDEDWHPLGGGTLVIDEPVVWLVTTAGVIEAAGEAPLAAWVSQAQGGTVLDLSSGHTPETGLSWITHPEVDLAATLFPIDASWGLKGFSEPRWLEEAGLGPGRAVRSLACPYGLPGVARPVPFVLDGVLSAYDAEERTIYTTAPLLPQNVGSPLLAPVPGSADDVALAGVITDTVIAPEGDQPEVRLTRALPTRRLRELFALEDARAQRQRVVSSERSRGDDAGV